MHGEDVVVAVAIGLHLSFPVESNKVLQKSSEPLFEVHALLYAIQIVPFVLQDL